MKSMGAITYSRIGYIFYVESKLNYNIYHTLVRRNNLKRMQIVKQEMG
ncbi:hypothetical protein [Lysinibacillus sphaericus]